MVLSHFVDTWCHKQRSILFNTLFYSLMLATNRWLLLRCVCMGGEEMFSIEIESKGQSPICTLTSLEEGVKRIRWHVKWFSYEKSNHGKIKSKSLPREWSYKLKFHYRIEYNQSFSWLPWKVVLCNWFKVIEQDVHDI